MSDVSGSGHSSQNEQSGQAHLFMVRLWQEQQGKRTMWCGKVQHVVTGRTRLLKSSASLRQLAELAGSELDLPRPEQTTREEK
ncbi:MAG TPA: hypothetical protein VF914_09875 [Chloroflexia bacterium]|jgi:hypothetical protein